MSKVGNEMNKHKSKSKLEYWYPFLMFLIGVAGGLYFGFVICRDGNR